MTRAPRPADLRAPLRARPAGRRQERVHRLHEEAAGRRARRGVRHRPLRGSGRLPVALGGLPRGRRARGARRAAAGVGADARGLQHHPAEVPRFARRPVQRGDRRATTWRSPSFYDDGTLLIEFARGVGRRVPREPGAVPTRTSSRAAPSSTSRCRSRSRSAATTRATSTGQEESHPLPQGARPRHARVLPRQRLGRDHRRRAGRLARPGRRPRAVRLDEQRARIDRPARPARPLRRRARTAPGARTARGDHGQPDEPLRRLPAPPLPELVPARPHLRHLLHGALQPERLVDDDDGAVPPDRRRTSG